MGLLAALANLLTTLIGIITKTGEVKTALVDLKDFLAAEL